MMEFITEKIPDAGRVMVDKDLLRLYPSADGMMHDECIVGVGGAAFMWAKAVREVPDTAQLHPTVYEQLAMKSVRNFASFGAYRPVALQKHLKARTFTKPRSKETTRPHPAAGISQVLRRVPLFRLD
ncbi:hypothetical protein ACKWRH_37115 [Bradyrhizobium sp. Pa8]|uniref:hypothetical protein n=1 Tax=Bradyrhizobium sp. Pa8 TaxID=3386552 RepID=UPI00403FC186